jgi:phage repressor protein C with HTH and peptisase S24 domain
MSLGARIAERLDALGGQQAGFSQAWLAREVGITQPAINSLIRNPEKGTKRIHQIARALQTNPDYLLGLIDDPASDALPIKTQAEIADVLGMAMIPEVDIAYALGGGAFIDDDHADVRMVPFRQDWLTRAAGGGPVDVFLARGIGDSMMPTILDEDDVLVNRAVTSIRQADRIWAVAYGGLGAIKRVRRLPNGLFQLNSDNQAVTPIEAAEDELHLIGRVIWIGRKV